MNHDSIKKIINIKNNRSHDTLQRKIMKISEEIGELNEAYLQITSKNNYKNKNWNNVREELIDLLVITIDCLMTELPIDDNKSLYEISKNIDTIINKKLLKLNSLSTNKDYDKYVNIVRNGYDIASQPYSKSRNTELHPFFKKFLNLFPKNSKLLDVGCGNGNPITKKTLEYHNVIGVDLSEKSIESAKSNFPNGKFHCSNITDLEFSENEFDGIYCLYSLIHFTDEDLRIFFYKASQWIKENGFLFCTLANKNQKHYTKNDFFGTKMYWNSLKLESYFQLLLENNFTIIEQSSIDSGYSKLNPSEYHPTIIATKRSNNEFSSL